MKKEIGKLIIGTNNSFSNRDRDEEFTLNAASDKIKFMSSQILHNRKCV